MMSGAAHHSYGQACADDLAAKESESGGARGAGRHGLHARSADKYPAINLNAKLDNHHATATSYYLAALVIYDTIYHDSAKGAPASRNFSMANWAFPPDDAADLQRASRMKSLAEPLR